MILLLMALILSCSTSTESVNAIVLSSNSEDLVIKNFATSKIYYFVVESNFAAHINWAAVKTGPFLERGESV